MPITKGAGNPTWTWDETLLALDLLYRHDAPIDRHHRDTISLSRLLRSARIHPLEGRKPSFRNADGVALKMQNLLSAIDQDRGLSSSKTDRQIVLEFPKTRARDVEMIAEQIRDAIDKGTAPNLSSDDDVFIEGHMLTSRHRRRESRIRKRLLARLSDDELICEMCGFVPPVSERIYRESFFEAHHVLPLAATKGTRSTRLSDMALLCANCHRFVHKLIAKEKRWFSIADGSRRLGK